MVTKTKRKHRKNKTRKKKLFKKLNCSPSADGHSFSCYSNEDLFKLKRTWNEKYPNIEITTNDPKLIWRMLKFYLKRKCDKESCWTSELVENQKEKSYLLDSFSPKSPLNWKKNPNEWLSSVEIINVMKQYERKYPSFLFMGPVPVDCPSSITCSLSGLDVGILINRLGKTKLGVVYNLDKHDEPGSHWVASYFDFKKGIILYFDSVGIPPPKMILNFLKKIKDSCQEYYKNTFDVDKDVTIYTNTTRFQFGDSECGIFSMHFIISNLKGTNMHYLNKSDINDEVMNQLRKIYYRPPRE